MTKTRQQYQFIEYHKGLMWPYHPNRTEIDKITTPEKWAPAVTELSGFLRSGKELALCPGVLLMKMQRVYVVTDDISHPEKIRKRSHCRYTVVRDESKKAHLDKRTLGVKYVFDTLDDVMENLRQEWNLGYERRFVDLWDKERIVATRPGFYE